MIAALAVASYFFNPSQISASLLSAGGSDIRTNHAPHSLHTHTLASFVEWRIAQKFLSKMLAGTATWVAEGLLGLQSTKPFITNQVDISTTICKMASHQVTYLILTGTLFKEVLSVPILKTKKPRSRGLGQFTESLRCNPGPLSRSLEILRNFRHCQGI